MPHLNSSDIELTGADLDKAFFEFRVINKNAVEAFVNDKRLQDFLQAEHDMDGAKKGCRLIITYRPEEEKLIIARKISGNTVIAAANIDLASSLLSFIWKSSDAKRIGDILGMVNRERMQSSESFAQYFKEMTNKSNKQWSRSTEFQINRAVDQKEVNVEAEQKDVKTVTESHAANSANKPKK